MTRMLFAVATLLGACAEVAEPDPPGPPPQTEISVSGSASIGVTGVLR